MTEICIPPGPWKVGSVLNAAFEKVLKPDGRVVQRLTAEEKLGGSIDELYESVARMILKDKGVPDAAVEFAVAKYKEDTLDGLLRLLRGEKPCKCASLKYYNGISFSEMLNLCDPLTTDPTGGVERREEALQDVVQWCIKLLGDELYYLATDVYQGYAITKEGFDAMENGILYLSHFVPWRDHIYACEREADKVGATNWIVFQDDRNGQYRATAVSDEKNRFDSRQLIREELRGLKAQDIREKLGITQPWSDAEAEMVFVHHSGFTCGAPTKELVEKLIHF